MTHHAPVLLSLRLRHAEAILAGTKTAELRRRPPRQAPPYVAVLYASAPRRAVVGCVRVIDVVRRPPVELWDAIGHWSAVSRAEFDAYFKGRPSASALLLADAVRIADRRLERVAPQSWRFLSPNVPGDEPLLELARTHTEDRTEEYGCRGEPRTRRSGPVTAMAQHRPAPSGRRATERVRNYRPEDRELVVAKLSLVIAYLYPKGDAWLESRLTDIERARAFSDVVLGPHGLEGITIETPKSRQRTKLSTIWVAEDARRRGVGSALIDTRRRDWLRRGVREAAVTARAKVAPSLERLLIPRGFEIVEVERERYGPGQDEVVLRWTPRSDPGNVPFPDHRLRWTGDRILPPTER